VSCFRTLFHKHPPPPPKIKKEFIVRIAIVDTQKRKELLLLKVKERMHKTIRYTIARAHNIGNEEKMQLF
jgi:hypothetical protein